MEPTHRVATVTIGTGLVAAAMLVAVVGPTALAVAAGIGAAMPVGMIYGLLTLDTG